MDVSVFGELVQPPRPLHYGWILRDGSVIDCEELVTDHAGAAYRALIAYKHATGDRKMRQLWDDFGPVVTFFRLFEPVRVDGRHYQVWRLDATAMDLIQANAIGGPSVVVIEESSPRVRTISIGRDELMISASPRDVWDFGRLLHWSYGANGRRRR